MVATPEPYRHYRATGQSRVESGVYRVVGTDSESVVVLRVADEEGQRVAAGELRTVSHEHVGETFADADNPDAGFRPGAVLDGVVEHGRAIVAWLGRVPGRG